MIADTQARLENTTNDLKRGVDPALDEASRGALLTSF
jgi:hypothetical protein